MLHKAGVLYGRGRPKVQLGKICDRQAWRARRAANREPTRANAPPPFGQGKNCAPCHSSSGSARVCHRSLPPIGADMNLEVPVTRNNNASQPCRVTRRASSPSMLLWASPPAAAGYCLGRLTVRQPIPVSGQGVNLFLRTRSRPSGDSRRSGRPPPKGLFLRANARISNNCSPASSGKDVSPLATFAIDYCAAPYNPACRQPLHLTTSDLGA